MTFDKDRQSRMAESSVNAPAKKDGAGGSFTWGSAIDDPTEYVYAEAAGPNVVVMDLAPAVIRAAEPYTFVNTNDNFPTLSGARVGMPVAGGVVQVPSMAPGARAWPASSAPKVILSESMLRPGTTDLYDGNHPRNQFAARPQVTRSIGAGPQLSLDWSSSGIPLEVNRGLIASTTANHQGLYQTTQAQRIPAQYLQPNQVMQAPVQNRGYRVQQPQVRQQHRNYAQASRGQCR